MLATPFLTDIDSRAAVKGSRDPLGIQQIWTGLGRHVVGNLTTVSNSVRDFTTLLLGYHFAEKLVDDLGPGTELSTFLKWEQLAAYSRAKANEDFLFRGTEKVRKNLSEGSRVILSDERSHQILSNQKIYGLWGLYSMPARSSGLLIGDPCRLTPVAKEFVERRCVPILEPHAGKGATKILQMLRSKQARLDVKANPLIEAVGKLLQPRLLKWEKDFFRTHLLHGGPDEKTDGRQQQLAVLLKELLSQAEFPWSTTVIGHLQKKAYASGTDWHPLAFRLHRIRTSESVLAPVSVLFTYLLGNDGKSIGAITARLREEWGTGLQTIDSEAFREMRGELGGGDSATADRWVSIADELCAGAFGNVLDLLIEQNASVMVSRGGAPWIEKQDGKLRVRFRDETGRLPKRDVLESLWRFPYFLDSLRTVARTLRGP